MKTVDFLTYYLLWFGGGGGVAQLVDRAAPGFNPRCDCPLPTGWICVSIMWRAETEVIVSPLCLMCGST